MAFAKYLFSVNYNM